MIKFFRRIRQALLSEGRFRTYFFYAIGEILLVVIGILIALQINSWNQNKINKVDERRYVNDLIQDLRNDSIALDAISDFMEVKAASKLKLVPVLRGDSDIIDSLTFHAVNQWGAGNGFSPADITIEELKNSGNLNLIRDVVLRREIVALYNDYSNAELTEDRYNNQVTKLLDIAGSYFRNVLEPKPEELDEAFKDKNFINAINANFTFARMNRINDLQTKCSNLILHLEAYKNQIDD